VGSDFFFQEPVDVFGPLGLNSVIDVSETNILRFQLKYILIKDTKLLEI